MQIPRCKTSVSAGSPHPIDELEDWVDLNHELIQHARTTYLFTVSGDSMEDGISDGDQLLVDRSVTAVSGKIIIIEVDGDFTVKRLSDVGGHLWLIPDNKRYKPTEINADRHNEVWGVVTYIIKKA